MIVALTTRTVPLVTTIVATTVFSVYLLFDPSHGIAWFMDLTWLSASFKLFILALALGGFACAYAGEQYLFVWLSRYIGILHDRLWPQRKKERKEYKVWRERMRC